MPPSHCIAVVIIVQLIKFYCAQVSDLDENYCFKDSICAVHVDKQSEVIDSRHRYLLYDVNPSEGFNLRRDVYLRWAIFLHEINANYKPAERWNLVLPPWPHLYHWQSTNIDQSSLSWQHFFDVASLNKFTPVIEMQDFVKKFDDETEIAIDQLYILKNYPEMFENGVFKEKYHVTECTSHSYGFYGYEHLTSKHFACLQCQGRVSVLEPLLSETQNRSILFHRAEIPLHDHFGDALYWKARRSMKFVPFLYDKARLFRKQFLNSTDAADKTELVFDWAKQAEVKREPRGGPFVCAHLRRNDFLRARPKEIPSVQGAVEQLANILQRQQLDTVFVATDATKSEYSKLKSELKRKNFKTHRYEPTRDEIARYKDGGVAIIDQIICSHARYFVGSHESTFSFRIQEEREIMGFMTEMTFNRFVGDEEVDPVKPSVWKIVY